VFVPSRHAFAEAPPSGAGEEALSFTFHQVESTFPASLTFDWRGCETVQDEKAGRPPVVQPAHVGTKVFGVIPVPLFLLGVRQRMCVHEDRQGWDLEVGVDVLGGRVNLITYKGAMRQKKEELNNKRGARFVDGFHDLVLFDGACNLCNASVDFLLARDMDRRLVFCAQQSPEAHAALEAYRRRHGAGDESTATDEEEWSGLLLSAAAHQGGNSILNNISGGGNQRGETDSVLVLGADGVLRAKSDAALRAGEALGGGWKVLSVAARVVLPVRIRDSVYDWIGRNRYRWFGRKETCRMPTEEERRSFL
jgi:predicted DCC family thiol-disulfide oxidoreductase YuxK